MYSVSIIIIQGCASDVVCYHFITILFEKVFNPIQIELEFK